MINLTIYTVDALLEAGRQFCGSFDRRAAIDLYCKLHPEADRSALEREQHTPAPKRAEKNKPPTSLVIKTWPDDFSDGLAWALDTFKKTGDARRVAFAIVRALRNEGCSKDLAIRALAALGYGYTEQPDLHDLFGMARSELEAMRQRRSDGTLGPPPRGAKIEVCTAYAKFWGRLKWGREESYKPETFRKAFEHWERNGPRTAIAASIGVKPAARPRTRAAKR